MLLGVFVAFAIPQLSLRTAQATESTTMFIATMQSWGVAYAVVSAALGLVIAITAWGYDHRLRHVYSLSLPIARWRRVLEIDCQVFAKHRILASVKRYQRDLPDTINIDQIIYHSAFSGEEYVRRVKDATADPEGLRSDGHPSVGQEVRLLIYQRL